MSGERVNDLTEADFAVLTAADIELMERATRSGVDYVDIDLSAYWDEEEEDVD